MQDNGSPSESSEEETTSFLRKEPPRSGRLDEQPRKITGTAHLVVLYLTNAGLLLALVFSLVTRPKTPYTGIYSPASNIVKYEDMVFLDNVYELSEFQGEPTDEKDKLWDMLYRDTGTTVVSSEEARKLPNATMVVPGTDGDGIISLEVFHQLHCLSLYPERYPDYSVFFHNGTRDPLLTMHHEHCIDRIRQATMCASDLGATYWRWLDDIKLWTVDMRSTHTCRNFEDIRKWAVERNLPHWDETAPSRMTFDQ